MAIPLRQYWGLGRPPAGPFTINRASPQAEGLVLWMPWGGGSPGSTHHVDRVHGLAFAEVGTPVWSLDGERGWSMLFDDASSEALEVDSAVISGPPFTMAGWAYSDSDTANQTVLCVADKDLANKMHFLFLAGGVAGDPVRMASLLSGGPSYATTTTGYSINTWCHAVGVVAAADSRAAYINGGSKGTNTTSESPSGLDRTSIGRLGDSSPTYYFSGRLADARIYNRALTDTEVWQLYDSATRWELYKPLRRLWQVRSPVPPPAGQPAILRTFGIPTGAGARNRPGGWN